MFFCLGKERCYLDTREYSACEVVSCYENIFTVRERQKQQRRLNSKQSTMFITKWIWM